MQNLSGTTHNTKRDKQKNGQTEKNSTFLVTLAAGEIRAPPSLAW